MIRLDKQVTNFFFFNQNSQEQSQNAPLGILTFESSNIVMIIKFSETSTKELELLDFEQDNIEGLGEAIDICSQIIKNGNNSQFYLYFVLTQPQFTINLEKDVRENKTYLFKRKKIIKEKNDLKN